MHLWAAQANIKAIYFMLDAYGGADLRLAVEVGASRPKVHRVDPLPIVVDERCIAVSATGRSCGGSLHRRVILKPTTPI